MRDRRRASEDEAVKRTLESAYVTPAIQQARDLQDELLRERFVGRRRRIADIGCGQGPHGSMFGPSCDLYHGFEIAPRIAEVARARWAAEGLDHARVFVADVAEVELEPRAYDLAICMYFTAGNLRDPSDDLGLYTDGYLDRNPRFIAVMSRFHGALEPGGALLLTVYKDVPEAEAAQHDFYWNTGQHVVTPPGSRFVATAERFWSVRFTRASMLSNLVAFGIEPHEVTFHDLNEIAWMVEVARTD